MIRLLILGLLGFGLYRALKSLLVDSRHEAAQARGSDKQGQMDDVLIQDPVCKTYFSRRAGVHLHSRGQDLYFCSETCRDRYLDDASGPASAQS